VKVCSLKFKSPKVFRFNFKCQLQNKREKKPYKFVRFGGILESKLIFLLLSFVLSEKAKPLKRPKAEKKECDEVYYSLLFILNVEFKVRSFMYERP
jgi:hypothetical protein